MDTEERKNDELFMLGCVTGLCHQEPRDEALLRALLLLRAGSSWQSDSGVVSISPLSP